jgi:Fe2+ transport system protein B
MSIIDKITNILQYKVYQATTDPDADAFAKEQKAARDKAAAAAAEQASAQATTKQAATAQSQNLTKAQYSATTFLKQIVKYTIFAFFIFLIILFTVYTGHLAANDAIGRPIEYRILYFIYGAIFSAFVAPYYIIQRLRGVEIKSYAILPVREGVVPEGLEGLLLSFVSYIPDEYSAAAKHTYETTLRATV